MKKTKAKRALAAPALQQLVASDPPTPYHVHGDGQRCTDEHEETLTCEGCGYPLNEHGQGPGDGGGCPGAQGLTARALYLRWRNAEARLDSVEAPAAPLSRGREGKGR